MTHASSARQVTARTKTANAMDSDTMAGAVDRRDGPACIEDRPYGRPRRSSPWPWPLTPSRRANRLTLRSVYVHSAATRGTTHISPSRRLSYISLACRAHQSECGRTPLARGRYHKEEPSP